ncbi:cation:proton antiporter [Cystobacter fuscus]
MLEGESLLNDATGPVAWRLAVAAVATGSFSWVHAGGSFVVGAAGGVAVGLAVGWIAARVHRRLDEPSIETTLTLLTPYMAWLAAEALELSGVLAVVSAGLYVSRQSSRAFAARLRLQAVPVWRTLGFLLESLLFILLGLELREVLGSVGQQRAWGPLLGAVVLLGLLVTAVRLLWIFPQAWLPRRLSARLRERDPMPPWRELVVLGWMGMRGAVSMAAALSVPLTTASGAPFPERERLLFLSYGVVLWTLLVQGLTLPGLIRWLGLHDDGLARREEVTARVAAADAALARIDALLAEGGEPQSELLLAMRTRQESRLRGLRRHLAAGKARPQEVEGGRLLSEGQQRLVEQVLEAQRQALLELRQEGAIHDEVLHRLERELDLEEERLHRRLPWAGRAPIWCEPGSRVDSALLRR